MQNGRDGQPQKGPQPPPDAQTSGRCTKERGSRLAGTPRATEISALLPKKKCSLSAHTLVRIGSGSLIGQYSIIMDCDYHSPDRSGSHGGSRPIVIGDGVWIGARVIVLKGVTVGETPTPVKADEVEGLRAEDVAVNGKPLTPPAPPVSGAR